MIYIKQPSFAAMLPFVLNAFGLDDETCKVVPFGNGLINSTWKVSSPGGNYILQKVNTHVFKQPQDIAANINMVAHYLKIHDPEYIFVAPIISVKGETLVAVKGDGFYRMFPFVAGSHSIDVVATADQAYEAAAQFGRFTKRLAGFNTSLLKTTIPAFHDVGLRYQEFITAMQNGNPQRIAEAGQWIQMLQSQSGIVTQFKKIQVNPAFKLRVTHHDTKISNVLFNDAGTGICVIDLDTIMPGYFFSDAGDMMRTCLCPVSEAESDLAKITIRDDFYKAIVEGYCNEMKDALTNEEKSHFFFAGKLMIYMQALRFITDYFNNDSYYGAAYPEQNFVRAKNQVVLLQRLLEKEPVLIALAC